MSRHILLSSVALAFVLLATHSQLTAPSSRMSDGDRHAVDVAQTFGHMPLYFIENQGQLDGRVAYYIQGRDRMIYFTATGLTFAMTAPAGSPADTIDRAAAGHDRETGQPPARWAIRLDFLDANPHVSPIAQEQTPATVSYFSGQPAEWNAGVRTYQRLVYPDLWPGIDLVYYGTVDQMKYEFIVRPGADPRQIRLAYSGVTSVRLTDTGELEVLSPAGNLTDAAPLAYQDIHGRRVPVSLAYDLAGASTTFAYGFQIGEYDPAFPLVLDPVVLIYAGYIGGAGSDEGWDIAVDDGGNVYVTGYTSSAAATFPVVAGPDLSHNGGYDAFVAKVNASGTALIYAGYLGGSSHDHGTAIAVDDAGQVYLTGYTWSTEASFPVTVGPDLTFNSSSSAASDAFVAKLNASGTALIYAGYLGGSDAETGTGIAVDDDGNAYVTGDTRSTEASFPVSGGPDLTFNGGYRDAFVAKVNATGSALIYAGYIGGRIDDYGVDVAVDGLGNAYITGETSSSQVEFFPVTVGPDLTFNGKSDVFVTKLNADGTTLLYAGYIGGSNSECGYGIAVDETGNAYVTGQAFSDQTTFPVTVGPDLTHNGGLTDAIVAKVNASGTALVYAGYIGGASGDAGYSIAVDDAGQAYVIGSTDSDQTTFPVAVGPDLTFNGFRDAFVAKVNATGGALDYAGYVGGSGEDIGYGVAVAGDHVYLTGKTNSNEGSFPVAGGPDLTYNGGGLAGDAFVAKISHLQRAVFLPLVKK